MLRLLYWLGWVPYPEYARIRHRAERYETAFRSALDKIDQLEAELNYLHMEDDDGDSLQDSGCSHCECE